MKFEETLDIDMQKSPCLKAYKEQTTCDVCVYDFEIKEICRNTVYFYGTWG